MVVDKVGEPAGKTTQTDTSSNAQSRQVAGAAKRKARARSPSPKTAYPSAFSQRRPLSRMNQTFGPNQTDPSNAIFMPRIRGLLDRGGCGRVGDIEADGESVTLHRGPGAEAGSRLDFLA